MPYVVVTYQTIPSLEVQLIWFETCSALMISVYRLFYDVLKAYQNLHCTSKKDGADIIVSNIHQLMLRIISTVYIKQEIVRGFAMTDLHLMIYCFETDITQNEHEVFICQKKIWQGDSETVQTQRM